MNLEKEVFSMKLAKRVSEIGESVTMILDTKAKALQSAGEDVINLTAGEPDFPPPKAVQRATCAAVKNGRTKYTPAGGILALKSAIAQKFKSLLGLEFEPKTQVVVTNGGKEAIYLALLATVDPGDEVLIFSPFWTSYPEMVKLCGGIPRILDIKDLNKLSNFLDSANIKVIMLNSPNNPTGMVLSQAQLSLLADALKERKIWVISDEIYSSIVFGENKHISMAGFEGMTSKTILIDGASKAFAMTGFRIGYAAGPAEVIGSMVKIKSQTSGCPNSIGQEATLAALAQADEDVQRMRAKYEERCNQIILPFARRLSLEYFEPQGAFYFFFKLPEKFNGNCAAFCEALLAKEKLGLVPGSAFGYPGWVRLSFAAADKVLTEGLARLERFLKM